MLIVCDFDGTITDRDLTDRLWDRYLPEHERKAMVARVSAGETTMLEFIRRGYEHVPKPPEALLDELRPGVRIRTGFERFVRSCRGRGWPMHVVSCGLAFYVREFLPCEVPFTCFVGRYDGRWHVELPDGVELRPGEEFKVNRLRALRAERVGETTVYIGDGRADFEPARCCERIFALRGSRLAKLCGGAGVPFAEFGTFDDIAEQIGLP